jgi:hypothetical protein
MNSQQVQDMRLMYEAVYNDELWELANEYNNSIYDEDIVEVATEYFYTYGLNEDGIDILIEKVGLDNFVEFVYDLSEDLTILTEARSAKKRTGGESYADVKAKIDAKEAAKKKAKEEALKRKESERMEPASNGADTESKKEQPKSKKPIRDAIARQILDGMKRHREATQTAGRLASETGNTLGKIASVTREAGRRAGEHVKKHGLKSLANEETEIGITGKKIPKPRTAKQQHELEKKRRLKKHLGKNVGGTQYSSDVNPYLNPRSVREEVETDLFDAILEHLVAEGYADTNESALAIMANMSEEWREEILDEAVRGSGRSIGDRITGNDIRKVTRGDKSVYKKPKWKDEVENKVDRQFPSTRRTQTSNTYDGGRDSNTIKANKKSINRMNAAKNIEVKQADGDYENSIDHSKPYGKGKSGYMEVPTDYRARNRRARGR